MTAGAWSAPGKLVLGGEYAVLHGYPAIAAAVSRRARVIFAETGGDVIEVETRGFRPGRWRLRAGRRGLAVPADAPLGLLAQAWAACAPDARGLRLVLDTGAFSAADGRKLGNGTSAALAVALTAALSDETEADALAARAGRVHSRFQGGVGSGIDVACAAHGGIVLFRDGAVERQDAALPSGLHCAVLWSGRPSSTPVRIAQLDRDLQQAGARASLAALGRAAETLAETWRGDDADTIVGGLADWTAALERFDRDLGLGIFAGGHAELAAAARHAGIVFKPCGAGGGDVGAAFSCDPHALEAFAERAGESGFETLGLSLGAAGAKRDGQASC